ncbi:MAG: hypothetical protein QNK05_24525 [Myxococcota bacterium]|nr:hypothetical protein [Myxococcota bacterium]
MRRGLGLLGLALLAWGLAAGVSPAPSAAQPAQGLRPPLEAETPEGVPESFRRFVESLEPEEQQLISRRLRGMRPAQRRRFLRRWSRANEAQLDRMQSRIEASLDEALQKQRERAEELGIDPDRLEDNRRAWQSMGDDKQRRMRARLERFAELDPEQQEAVVSVQFANRSEAERARILENLRRAAERLQSGERGLQER